MRDARPGTRLWFEPMTTSAAFLTVRGKLRFGLRLPDDIGYDIVTIRSRF